jgi:NTE family protein
LLTKDIDFENFSLVLSGGGALGIAHLGIIKKLEKKSIVPKEIVGTSMGAIIGACVAIGLKEKEIYKLFKEFSNISNWIRFSFSGNYIVKSTKIEKIFDNIFHNLKDTKIPLKIVATNIENAQVKVFDKDDDVYIKDAVLASMAIPGIFEEKIIDGVVYADGFLTENLAINQTLLNEILAVDVLGTNSFSSKLPNNIFKTQNIMGMFEKSMRILMYNQSKVTIKNSRKNIYLVEPTTKDFKTYHFHKYKEIRKVGLETTLSI